MRRLGEWKQSEPDEIEKLILKWRERARLMRRIGTEFKQSSSVTELEQCASDLEVVYIGLDLGAGPPTD